MSRNYKERFWYQKNKSAKFLIQNPFYNFPLKNLLPVFPLSQMDLDLKICIPQRSFEKNVRIRTPLMTLTHLETQIRERFINIPSPVSFHLDKDPQSQALDATKLLKNYGFGGFSQENKTLYIYFNESTSPSEPSEQSSTRSSTVTESTEKKKVIVGIEKKIPHQEILVTILNPFLITNNTFMANSSMKLGELVDSYKQRLDWRSDNDSVGFSFMDPMHIFSPELCLHEVTKEDEVILYVRERAYKNQNSKKPESLEMDSDVEFVEKKNKPVIQNAQRMQEEIPQATAPRIVKVKQKSHSVNKENYVFEEKKDGKGGSVVKNTPVQILKSINKDLDSLVQLKKMTENNAKLNGNGGGQNGKQNHFVIDEDPLE